MACGLARRARLLGDPGRLAARLHDRGPGRHASTCSSAARCSAASRRFTTGSRSSPAGCWARASARSRLGLMLARHPPLRAARCSSPGLKGQPVDIYKFYDDTGVDGFNLVASIACLRARRSGILLELGNAAYSYRNGVARRDTTRGAARRSSGSRSRRPPSTTSTPSPTCAAPSRCTTFAGDPTTDRELAAAPAARSPVAAEPEPEAVEVAMEESGGDGPSGGAPVA